MDSFLTARLEQAVGVPAPDVRFVRVHINGGYYHYMMELEDVGEPLLERYHAPDGVFGDLWKSNGTFGDQGPFGPGNESVLAPACGYTSAQRYAATYKRRSFDYRGPELLAGLIDGLAKARAAGPAAVRAFLAETFDVDRVLSHIAVVNWAGAWDDAIHNHFVYRRPDGKWIIAAWDYDQLYGVAAGVDGNAVQTPTASFYSGQEGDPNNKLGWNLVKDAFLRTYRAEFDKRLVDLSRTVLAPAMVEKHIDDGVKAFSMKDWMATPGRQSCDVPARVALMRKWARERDAALAQRFGRAP